MNPLFFYILSVFSLAYFSSGSFAQKTASPSELLQNIEHDPVQYRAAHGRKNPHARLTPDKHIQVALQHKARGRMSEGIASISEALLYYPDNARLYALRGSFYLEQKQIATALKDLEKALAIDPKLDVARVNRAQAYRSFGRISEALADLDAAININPDLLAAYFNRGAIYYSSQEYQKALRDFEQCIAIDPHMPAPYFNRAATYYALGQKPKAIADLQQFLQINKNPEWKKTVQVLLQKWNKKIKE